MTNIEARAAQLSPADFDFPSRRELGASCSARVFAVKFHDEEVAVKFPTTHALPEEEERQVRFELTEIRLLSVSTLLVVHLLQMLTHFVAHMYADVHC